MADKNTKSPKGILLVLLLLAVVATLLLYAKLLMVSFESYPERGQFGDMFGALNAAFSGLAFASVVYAIFLQREELELQRKELELAREEYKRIADVQEASQRLQLLGERIKATRFAVETGQAALSKVKESPRAEDQPWVPGLEVMLAAQVERLMQLFNQLEELDATIDGKDSNEEALQSHPAEPYWAARPVVWHGGQL